MLGLINMELPGPLNQYYDEHGSGVVLSMNTLRELGQLENGTRIKFDDLELPYHIPIFPCDELGEFNSCLHTSCSCLLADLLF